MNTRKNYGWKPDLPDVRDFKYKLSSFVPFQTTNNRYNLIMPPIQDQLNLGSCTGNACASIMNFLYLNGHFQYKPKVSPVPFSRLFIYYNERLIENTVSQDAGAQIRDGIKVLAAKGVPPETLCPYNVDKFTKIPSHAAWMEATKYKAIIYERLNNVILEQLVACLVSGFPFVFGFSVYESFETLKVATTGIVPMPLPTEQLLGGHCVWCIDYDADQRGFWCVNSWGSSWGKEGLFFLSEEYLTNTNLADDFWTIKIIK